MGKRGRPGSGVEVRGDSIRITFTVGGERCRETLDLRPTAPNLKYANRLAAEIKDKVRLGVFDYVATFPNSKRAAVTAKPVTLFGEYADAWLATQAVQKSTFQSYRQGVSFWKKKFANRPLDSITAMEIRTIIVDRLTKVSAKTVNNNMTALRGMYELAVGDGVVQRNPTLLVKSQSHQKPEPDPFSRQEMERILFWMRENAPKPVTLWYTLAFLTGMRPSEQRALRPEDYNQTRQTIRVARALVRGVIKPTKTYAVREVDLSCRAVRVVETLLSERTGFLFGDVPPSDDDFKEWQETYWYPCLDALGMPSRISYNTRHTFATVALMNKANPAYISRQLGHINMKMLLTTYSKWIDGADEGRERAKVAAAFDFAPSLPHDGASPRGEMARPTGIETDPGVIDGNAGEKT